jgi:hypothetical protein
MWNSRRKAIWLSVALVGATCFAYINAHDEADGFDGRYFAMVEVIFVGVVVLMFYMYNRRGE